MLLFNIIFTILYFFFGAAVFSFLGVIADRVPRGEKFLSGHSHCNYCGLKLKAKELIPVISYLALGGRCTCCRQKIPLSCLVVELIGGALAVVCVFVSGNNLAGVYVPSGYSALAFLMIAICTPIFIIDMETMEIPNGLILALLVCLPLSFLFMPQLGLLERGIGLVCVSLPMFLLTLAIPGAFGGGDIKLLAVTGLILGWKLNLLGFFVGALIGGVYAFILIVSKKKKRGEHIAFGPYLCIGTAVALLFGDALISWYAGLMG